MINLMKQLEFVLVELIKTLIKSGRTLSDEFVMFKRERNSLYPQCKIINFSSTFSMELYNI